MKTITLAIVLFVTILNAAWAQTNTTSPPPTTPTILPAAAPVAKPVTPPVAPMVQAPTVATPAVAQPSQPTPPPSASDLEIKKEFQSEISFPINEAKIIAFAHAAIRVEKINQKWDVQISSAPRDQVAVEYNNMSIEEITNAMKSMPGLTIAEFNELTQLTLKDDKFNRVYGAYKQLIIQGKIDDNGKMVQTVPESQDASPSVVPNAASPAIAQPLAPVSPMPAATPANPDTAPKPAGSTATPYSPPATH